MGKALKLSYQQREEIARKLFPVKSIRGSELHGLCPYHDDSNPSLSNNAQKDVFNCLACGAGGDLIKLWSKVAGSGNLTDNFKAFSASTTSSSKAVVATTKTTPPPRRKKRRASEDKMVDQADLNRTWSSMSPLPAAWRSKLQTARGWSDSIMDRLDLRVQSFRWDKRAGELKEIKKPERIAFPVTHALILKTSTRPTQQNTKRDILRNRITGLRSQPESILQRLPKRERLLTTGANIWFYLELLDWRCFNYLNSFKN